MHIGIHLSNHLMAEAIYQVLVKNGYDDVVTSGRSPTSGFTPDVLLVDIATLTQDLLAQYPEAKVLLFDTGIEPEKLCATLLSYRIHGILSPHTEIHLFKKALKVVSEGQIWIDNSSVKAVLHDKGMVAQPDGISGREQEVIDCACQGLSNSEIARKLIISPHTVKAHLTRIFRKLNITSRAKLMTRAATQYSQR
ncbi:MAG TPA: response regulator transcription factor [Syntrophorhabdales bacterium]|nr:response regulator transcription factor [Syntrophorhabdales bacterium]